MPFLSTVVAVSVVYVLQWTYCGIQALHFLSQIQMWKILAYVFDVGMNENLFFPFELETHRQMFYHLSCPMSPFALSVCAPVLPYVIYVRYVT